MFSRPIDNLSPWTDRGMFEHVSACSFSESGARDFTMVATATALIERRVSEPFSIKIVNLPTSGGVLDDPIAAVKAIVKLDEGCDGDPMAQIKNKILISQYLYTNDTDDAVDKLFAALDAKFTGEFAGWESPEKSQTFLNGYMKVRIFMNKENNAALIFTERLTMSKWHLIQAVLPTFVPGIFKDEPLEQQEKTMLHTLTGRNVSNYLRELSMLEEKYDIRNKKIKAMIGDFEARSRQNQLRQIDNERDRIRQEMANLMERYRNALEQYDAANIRWNGMKYAIDNANDGSDLISYFQANKSIDLLSVNDTMLEFIVRTRYENFDLDEYETYRTNDDFLRESRVIDGVFASAENRRKFMDAMFCTEKLKVRLCARFQLDIRYGVQRPASGYAFPSGCESYIPNYHLHHHSCLGNYERIINEYVQRGDTIGAIEACVASAKSINIAESGATFHPFMKLVFQSTKKCIELPDGRNVTPAEAFAWLEEQEGAERA